MRNRKFAMIVLVALALAPGTFVRTPTSTDATSGVSLRAMPVEASASSPLSLVAAWKLESTRAGFGGYSALLALPDGRFLAGSDTGRLMEFSRPDKLPPGKPRVSARFGTFPESNSSDKRDVDLEALAFDHETGSIWAAYERSNSIIRHASISAVGDRVAPEQMQNWGSNSGPEAMVRLNDGRFIVIAEQRTGSPRPAHEALLFPGDPIDNAKAIAFSVSAPDGLRPVDMALMPDGRIAILLRRVDLMMPPRFASALAIADPEKIVAGEVWPLDSVTPFGGDVPLENYEGLAVIEEDGATHLWVISDDNLALFQDTLLLKFRWTESARKKARGSPRTP